MKSLVPDAILNRVFALVSLIDENRQWFKSRVGLQICETPREAAFCAHTILGSEPLIVNDATQDRRFAENPLVVGELGIRFYAGVPLRCGAGLAMGTLCVIDQKPHELSDAERHLLKELAYLAERELVHRASRAVARELSDTQLLAIRQNEVLFRSLFDLASVGFAMVGLDGRLLKVNAAFAAMLNYTPAELEVKTFDTQWKSAISPKTARRSG